MTDIVVRLRDWEEYDEGKINDTRVEAADTILSLRAENEKLRAALGDVHAAAKDNHLVAKLARAALEAK